MSLYSVFGPFEIKKDRGLVDIHKASISRFWGDIEQRHPGLPGAVGCYIFAIQAAKGSRPWYVGKTEKRSFKGETWTTDKINKYNYVLNRRKGTAQLYLIAKRTKGGRLAKPRKGGIGEIRALENLLIGSCLLRNSELRNVKQTKHLRGIVVPGYMNGKAGALSRPVKGLAKLLRK